MQPHGAVIIHAGIMFRVDLCNKEDAAEVSFVMTGSFREFVSIILHRRGQIRWEVQ
jgi:hypothetical protein